MRAWIWLWRVTFLWGSKIDFCSRPRCCFKRFIIKSEFLRETQMFPQNQKSAVTSLSSPPWIGDLGSPPAEQTFAATGAAYKGQREDRTGGMNSSVRGQSCQSTGQATGGGGHSGLIFVLPLGPANASHWYSSVRGRRELTPLLTGPTSRVPGAQVWTAGGLHILPEFYCFCTAQSAFCSLGPVADTDGIKDSTAICPAFIFTFWLFFNVRRVGQFCGIKAWPSYSLISLHYGDNSTPVILQYGNNFHISHLRSGSLKHLAMTECGSKCP